MSDHADIVRETLNSTPDVVGNKPTRKDLAYRALDALVAERDEAILRNLNWRDEAREAQAEVARLKEFMECADTPLMRDVLAERDEARQQALDASRVGGGAMAEVARRGDLLRRLRQWDHMASAADGPYWIREIDAALGEGTP